MYSHTQVSNMGLGQMVLSEFVVFGCLRRVFQKIGGKGIRSSAEHQS